MRLNKKRISRKRRKDLLGIFFIIIGVCITVAISFMLFVANSNKQTLDPETLCPTTGAKGKTVVLIDRTDPLTNIQQQELKVFLHDIKTAIPLHAAISIYGMDRAIPNIMEPEISLCNPGKGENKSPWLSNPVLINKVWQGQFSDQLNVIITRMMEPLEVPNSPIMETIKAVTIAEFIGEENKDIPKRLVIVSDLMQHTSAYSHYRDNSNFSSYVTSNAFKQHLFDLDGVNVEILYIRRPKLSNVQGKKHIQFWEQYIHAMSGTLTRVRSIN